VGMEHQTQITDEQEVHSSVHLTRVTVPPPAEALVLVQSERALARISKAQEQANKAREQGDIVVTVKEQPELINSVARMLDVNPISVAIHLAIINKTLIQAVFVDGKLRRDRAARRPLNNLNFSGPSFGQRSIELVLTMSLVV